MAIVVVGAVFVDVKGFPEDQYIPTGRNAGKVEIVHGGVGRNVAEDIANIELRPTFVSLVDDTAEGVAVINKLRNHKVNTDYIRRVKDGMGMWLAVFDNMGDIAGSISKRPDLGPICEMLDEKGDEIFRNADSIIMEIDIDKEIVKRVFRYAEKYHKPVYAVVANMSIATQRRDFLQSIDCFVCNQQEAGILFVSDFSATISPAASSARRYRRWSSRWAAAARCTPTCTATRACTRRRRSPCATRPARETHSAQELPSA